MRRGQTRRFTYGYGRAEDLAGVIIVGLIFLSACVAGYESIRKLIDPQPVSHLWRGPGTVSTPPIPRKASPNSL